MMAFEHWNTSPTQRQAALQVQKLSPYNQPTNKLTNRQRGGAGGGVHDPQGWQSLGKSLVGAKYKERQVSSVCHKVQETLENSI
jgi:hypothetical protein